MIVSLILMLLVTILATLWSRHLASDRNRNIGAWALATALFPPLVVILWALPSKALHQEQA